MRVGCQIDATSTHFVPIGGLVNGKLQLGSFGSLGSHSGPCSRLHVVIIICRCLSHASPDHFRDATKLIGLVNSSNGSTTEQSSAVRFVVLSVTEDYSGTDCPCLWPAALRSESRRLACAHRLVVAVRASRTVVVCVPSVIAQISVRQLSNGCCALSRPWADLPLLSGEVPRPCQDGDRHAIRHATIPRAVVDTQLPTGFD